MSAIEYLRRSIDQALALGYVTGDACESAITVCHLAGMLAKNGLVSEVDVFWKKSGHMHVTILDHLSRKFDVVVGPDGRTYDLAINIVRDRSIDDLSPIEEEIQSLKDDADMNVYDELRSIEIELSELANDTHAHARRIAATLQQVRTLVVAAKREQDEPDAQPKKAD